MEPISSSFFDDVKSFARSHVKLCVLTFGLAVVGYSIGNLAGRAIAWIEESFGSTKKSDIVCRKVIGGIGNEILTSESSEPPILITSTRHEKSDNIDHSQKHMASIITNSDSESGIIKLSTKVDSVYMKTNNLSKLSKIQAALPKNNGYPSVGFNEALDLLGKQSLKPTLLLIDEVEKDTDPLDAITISQLNLIKKVQKMGGEIMICTRPAQPDVRPSLKQAVAESSHTFYSIEGLNKLENQELRTKLQTSDFVIVAGFDKNECVRSTIGAKLDDRGHDSFEADGMIQKKIPVLYSDDCSRGLRSNVWEGSRFEDSLFFWDRTGGSNYRLADQAVIEYRNEMGNKIPNGFTTTFNNKTLEYIQQGIYDVQGLTSKDIKEWFLHYKIAPDNPLLDQISKQKS